MKKILIMAFSVVFIFCMAQDTDPISPKILDECYFLLDSIFPEKDKEEIRLAEGSQIMDQYHFSVGLYIRNYWLRNGDGSLMSQINFKPWKVGIDDLGGVILTGYWHYLHKKEFHWELILESAEKYYESCLVREPLSL